MHIKIQHLQKPLFKFERMSSDEESTWVLRNHIEEMEEPKQNDENLLETLHYMDQASKIIWDLNSKNGIEISCKLNELIKSQKITIDIVLFIIDSFSILRKKEINLFTEFYLQMSNGVTSYIKPVNKRLKTLLHYKGLKFHNFEPKCSEEDILNLYDKESPLYYIAWDKVDELKSKFPDLDVDVAIKNKNLDNKCTPLECACKYGSELCFFYFKNIGAEYTKCCAEYAVIGENFTIFDQMIDDEQNFDYMVNIALKYIIMKLQITLKRILNKKKSL